MSAVTSNLGRVAASRRSRWVLLGVVACAALVVSAAFASLGVPSALAARGHVFAASFSEKGTGIGQLEEPSGVAIDEETGDVYVVDKGNNRVEVFNAKGEYQFEFDGSGELPNECKLGECIAAGHGGKADEVPTGRFSAPQGIAIDNSCAQHRPEPLTGAACEASDPSNGDVYVVDGYFSKVIDKFTSTGEYVGQIIADSINNPKMESFQDFIAVAVDPRGEVWVSENHDQQAEGGPGNEQKNTSTTGVDKFSNTETNLWDEFLPNPIPTRVLLRGLAVDSADNVYSRRAAEGATDGAVVEFSAKSGLINETVGGETAAGVAFGGVAVEPSTNDVYVDNATSIGRFGPFVAGRNPEVERFGSEDLPKRGCVEELGTDPSCAGGIAVESATGEVYIATSSDAVQRYILENPSTPRVEGESFVDVTNDSATFDAEINPRSFAGEAGTSYRFEYGLCSSPSACATSAYEGSTPSLPLGASFNVESVSAHVDGLTAGAAYHFRVVTENGHGVDEQDSEQTFTTRATGEFALPDARQWQLVSPPDKHGALIEPIGMQWVIQAAAGGGAITYATDFPTESEPAGYDNFQQVLSTRGMAGWSSQDISVPHSTGTGVSIGEGQEVRFFSEDLSQAVVQPFGPFVPCRSAEGVEQPCLSPQASEQTAFLHDNYSGGGGEFCTSSCYTPLVTGCPPLGRECRPAVQEHANVPPGTVFGQVTGDGKSCPPDLICGPEFLGATPDLGHVVLTSGVRLTEKSPPNALYEWSAGKSAGEQLQLVSMLPGSESGVSGTLSSSSARNAISRDGSRIVWEREAHLYLRDTVKHETVQLDAGLSGSPVFQMASSDISKVFFTDGGSSDLYEYDVEHGELVRLTENAEVVGSLPGASEDGSWVYFVANGVLGDGAEHGAVAGNCQRGGGGQATQACNLYVSHDGTTKLVAVLSGADNPDWSPSLNDLTSRVSPNGEWLAFMSQRSLTGYDNSDAVSGRPDEEVYEYDAATGALVCASCNPTGARPHGVEYGVGGNGVNPNLPLAGGDRVWPGTAWLAANIPGWTPGTGGAAGMYQSRALSDSGRLFFNSSDGLVPKDVNGQEDVYEYEPQGVPAGEHACSSAVDDGSEVFKAERGFEVAGEKGTEGAGCAALISSGSSAQESAFLDASESGGDVFFLTTSRLASQDFDNALDVYDAHECTAQSPCLAEVGEQAPACNTEASCKAAPSPQPPIYGLSGSATFSGTGNVPPPTAVAVKSAARLRAEKLTRALKACRKERSKRRHAACEKQARRRYGASKAAKRVGNERRAK